MTEVTLLTRDIPAGDRVIEQIVGAEIDGVDVPLPKGSRLVVGTDAAGDDLTTVTLTVFADRVRFRDLAP